MSKVTLVFVGIGVVLIALIAVLGIRFSFVSADVTALANALGACEVDRVRIAESLAGCKGDASVLETRLAECGARVNELATALDRSKSESGLAEAQAAERHRQEIVRYADRLSSAEQRLAAFESSEVSVLMARNGQLEERIKSLEAEVARLSPPTLTNPKRPSLLERWRNYRGGETLALAKYRFGEPAVTLHIESLQSGGSNQWGERSWEDELFPRYRSGLHGWPWQLEVIREGIAATPGIDGQLRRSADICIWYLDKDTCGVLVVSDRGNAICVSTLQRRLFPDLK